MPYPSAPPQGFLRSFGAEPPLQGLTLLLVEDSRYASDGIRLLVQRSGGRMRRVESLREARRHLTVYRPDVVIVDMSLPDGPGHRLIRALATAGPAAPVVLGFSGDPGQRGVALSAGAQGFLEKPVERLADFQAAVLRHLPGREAPAEVAPDPPPRADSLALQEDYARAVSILGQNPGAGERAYLSRFLQGLARSTGDQALARAASGLEAADAAGIAHLGGLVAIRMQEMPPAFGPAAGV